MGLVGSSPIAGSVGLFDTVRGAGEMLLVKHGISTPMLYAGSAYMHATLEDCVQKLKYIAAQIEEQGLPD